MTESTGVDVARRAGSDVAADPSASPAPRLDSLTGLRWWAAFAVFLFHMRGGAPLPHMEPLFVFGDYGVTFFFVLSGFVLTWSARPQVAVSTFWWRRFARIYPSHFVALLIAIPVFYSFTAEPTQPWVKPFDLGIILLSVVLLQGWSRDPAILFSGNPAAWTLTCEAFFYALHPALHRAFLRLKVRGALWLTVAVFGAAFAYRAASLIWPGTILAEIPIPVVRLTEFVIGIGIARAMRAGWRVRIRPIYCYVGGAALLASLILVPRLAPDDRLAGLYVSFANEWIILLCAITIASVAWRDVRGRRSLLRSRVLVVLGEWSYAFYLVHATIIYAFFPLIGTRPASWWNLLWFAAALIAALAGAALLHYLVERPCERGLRRWWDGRAARRAAPAAAS